MKAFVVGETGPELADVPEPQAGPGSVVVRVHAAALNRADLGMAQQGTDGLFHLGQQGVLHLAGDLLHFRVLELQNALKQHLGQAVTAHDLFGMGLALPGKQDLALAANEQALAFQFGNILI